MRWASWPVSFKSILVSAFHMAAVFLGFIYPQFPSCEEVYILDIWPKWGWLARGVLGWHPGREWSVALTGLYSPLPLTCEEEAYRGLVPILHV